MTDGDFGMLATVVVVVVGIVGYGMVSASMKRHRGKGNKKGFLADVVEGIIALFQVHHPWQDKAPWEDKPYRPVDDGRLDLANLPDVRTFPYRPRFKFMSDREKVFYDLLCDSAELVGCKVCAKVRLGDIFWVPGDSTNQGKEFWKWFAPISSRHVDFLVLDPKDKMLFAIELDDPTHNSTKAQQSDRFKDAVFASAGFALIRIREVPDSKGMDALFTIGTERAQNLGGKGYLEVVRLNSMEDRMSDSELHIIMGS